LRHVGQKLERFGDAQLLRRETRRVAEQSLDVLVKCAVAELHVHARAERGEQRAAFFEVESGALFGETNERVVSTLPVGAGGGVAQQKDGVVGDGRLQPERVIDRARPPVMADADSDCSVHVPPFEMTRLSELT
jgi:hypothetical protein